MCDKVCRPKWGPRAWLVFFTVFAIELAGTTVRQLGADEITGTISKAEPPDKQDGTAARPFAESNQCPAPM
jgi:hypothetical protein